MNVKSETEYTNVSTRYPFLDNLRGMTLLSMILYHAVWDMVYIFGAPWGWFRSQGAYLWQQSICWTFILLSGFCQGLARRPVKNGLKVFGAGLLVTAATLIFMPAERVVFGVLTLIGSCMLLLVPMRRILDCIPSVMGCIAGFLLFALFKGINGGWLGFFDIPLFRLPGWLYANLCTAYLGFPAGDFYSTDYFSLIPWFFLYLTGYFICRLLGQGGKLRLPVQNPLPVFSFMGRNSLIIYLLHQPLVYGVLLCGTVFFP
ncbi:MAG TPA: hypothetical protein DF613_11450 [Lachnospiraceae bacterium]|nr:hypothetical protein [Lachnospiraceae bacterium]